MIVSTLMLSLLLSVADASELQAVDKDSRVRTSGVEDELRRAAGVVDEANEPSFDELVQRALLFERTNETPPPSLRRALRDAVAREVAADPSMTVTVLARSRLLRATLLLAIIDGFVDSGAPESISALSDMLGSTPGMDVFILDAIKSLARESGGPFQESSLNGIRFSLKAREVSVRCAAAGAAGALRDDDAIPQLIEMLSTDSALEQAAAHAALMEHTGFGYGPKPHLWDRWYQAERSYLNNAFGRHSRELRGRDQARQVQAAKGIAAGRLARDERARALVEGFSFVSDEALALQILSGLRTLDSRVAVPLLEELAADDSREVLSRVASRGLARLQAD